MATEGGYNLGILLLVIVLLTVGNLMIIRDATRLVIVPMERVLAVLKQVWLKYALQWKRINGFISSLQSPNRPRREDETESALVNIAEAATLQILIPTTLPQPHPWMMTMMKLKPSLAC